MPVDKLPNSSLTCSAANTQASAVLSRNELEKIMRRRFQRGTVFLRGKRNPVWVGRWREDVVGPDGKLQRVARKEEIGTKKDFPTKKLILRELETKLAGINSPNFRPVRIATFAQFVKTWQTNALSQHKDSTQSSINSQIRCHLNPFFGEMTMARITGEDFQRFVNSRSCEPKTVKNLIMSLHLMWKSAKAWGYSSEDPFEGLVLPKRHRREAFHFTLAETIRIINEATGKEKTCYWIAAETGMRAGEIFGLRTIDIYVENCVIAIRQSAWRTKIQTPKTDNAFRQFPISPQLAAHLEQYLENWRPNEKNLLFINRKGNPWTPCNVVRNKLKPLLRKLKIEFPERCGLHAFRHTSVSLMDHIQAPMKVQQERVGHALGSKTTLKLYTHAFSEDHRKVAAQLGSLLCPTVPNLTDEGNVVPSVQ